MARLHEGLTAAALASETLQATSLRYNYGHGKRFVEIQLCSRLRAAWRDPADGAEQAVVGFARAGGDGGI